jgi:hypothetical protein
MTGRDKIVSYEEITVIETQILEKRILELEKSIEILFKLNHDLEYKLINFKQLLFKPKYD